MDIKDKLEQFIDNYNYEPEIDYSKHLNKNYVTIDFKDLCEYDPKFADDFLENFEYMLGKLRETIGLIPRFINIPASCEKGIWKLRAEDVGKFVSLKGYIKTVSNVFHYAQTITYSCPKCSNRIEVEQDEPKVKVPLRCSCGKKKGFIPVSKKMSDIQKIVLEEDAKHLDGSQMPRSIVVKLKGDLCSDNIDRVLQPSKKIKIDGIIKDEHLTKDSIEFTKFLEAHNVKVIDDNYQVYKFTSAEVAEFEEVSKSKTLYEDMAQSIYPTIYGNDTLKQALFLQLIGGVHLYSEGSLNERGNIHILVISSPGAGKTQLINNSAMFLNNSKVASGNSSTGCGLIASVSKDPQFGGWVLEAGAIPRANKSIFIADEMDKADPEDIAMLNNAMVDGFVTINKANIHHRLETDVAILAAANPKHRVFDRFEPVWKQIDLPKDFLDRFDLIFPADVIESEDEQRKVASKIFSKYRKTELTLPRYDSEFVRKYISYARQTYKPTVNSEVEEYITDRFVKIVAPKSSSEESAYFSSRLITNIIRLTQAAAKARLMPTTSPRDADKAINILIDSLKRQDILQEDQVIDYQKLEGITPKPKREMKYLIKNTVNDLEKSSDDNSAEIQKVVEVVKCAIADADTMEIDEMIDKLKRSGDVYEPRRGFLRTVR